MVLFLHNKNFRSYGARRKSSVGETHPVRVAWKQAPQQDRELAVPSAPAGTDAEAPNPGAAHQLHNSRLRS
jgi:hypothetical protein